ncbi:MAG: metallophosphoesterase [Sandaracinaceae bacterium]|nr:metallophosphoesterase [Sandaracinaceae bacterium]
MQRLMLVLGVVFALGACGGGQGNIDGGGARADAGDAGRADAGRDGGAPDAGAPDGGPPPRAALQFVALGDTGEGNAAQREVAQAILQTCTAEGGCDFAILLGDNIYNAGVESVTDSQWQTKFEEPYRDLDFPFYAVLGNHDYGGTLFGLDQGGLGNEWDRGPIEVAYTDVSAKWTMPDTFYTFRYGNVGFVVLDTNSMLWGNTDNGDQRTWFQPAVDALRAEGAEWILLAGHHTYRSNGAHGDAGSYESLEIAGVQVPNPLPILNGNNVRSFFDEVVCGQVDVYLCGHDHNRQWIDEPGALCGAELIVSGAGSKTKDFDSSANDVHWADADTEGFLFVRIEGDTFYGRFVNRDGSTAFERMLGRR